MKRSSLKRNQFVNLFVDLENHEHIITNVNGKHFITPSIQFSRKIIVRCGFGVVANVTTKLIHINDAFLVQSKHYSLVEAGDDRFTYETSLNCCYADKNNAKFSEMGK